MSAMTEAVKAAEGSWSSLPMAKVDESPYVPGKDLKAPPHALTEYVTDKPTFGKETLAVGNVSARLPSGQAAEDERNAVAGRLPGKIAVALGIGLDEAKEKAAQMIALHELGHCKDYTAMKDALKSYSGSPADYEKWASSHPDLAKGVPLDMDAAMRAGASPAKLKEIAKGEAMESELEASADVFAINAGAKAGLWNREKMFDAVKDWRTPLHTNDMAHDTRQALSIAKDHPEMDHNEVAKEERKRLQAMPGEPDGFEWDSKGQPTCGVDKMFALERRKVMTGMDITETAPAPSAAPAPAQENLFVREMQKPSSGQEKPAAPRGEAPSPLGK